ncbi:hypothetical protein HS121_17720 [bacterium]|nr:hypothetical protein [bacterium]
MKEVEVGALGAAILAGVGAGIFDNPAQGAAAMVNTGDISPFSADNHAEYNRIYARYEDYSRRLYGEAPGRLHRRMPPPMEKPGSRQRPPEI